MGMDESSAPKFVETTGWGQVAAHSKEVITKFTEGGIAEVLKSSLIDGIEFV